MGFVHNDVFMRTHESEFTHISRVDLQLRGNDYAKIIKKTQTANLCLDFHAYGIISINYNTWVLSSICQIECEEGRFSKLELVWEIWVGD